MAALCYITIINFQVTFNIMLKSLKNNFRIYAGVFNDQVLWKNTIEAFRSKMWALINQMRKMGLETMVTTQEMITDVSCWVLVRSRGKKWVKTKKRTLEDTALWWMKKWKGNNSIDSWLSSMAKGTRLDFPQESLPCWDHYEKTESIDRLAPFSTKYIIEWRNEMNIGQCFFPVIKWIFPFWCSFLPWKENSMLIYAHSWD